MSKTHKVNRDLSWAAREIGDPGAKSAAQEIKRIARMHRRRIVAKRAMAKRAATALAAGAPKDR